MPAACEFFYFDLGNVLLSFSHEQGHRQMAALAGVETALVKEFFTQENRQLAYESGQVSTDELIAQFCAATGSKPETDQLLLAAGDIFAPIPATIEILQGLHTAGHRLGLLSNTCDAHWRVCTDGRFPFLLEVFESAVLSFEEYTAKPDEDIYRIAAERCGAVPESIFFVDDRPENVESAQAFGFDAVLFEGPEKLLADLEHRGVSIRDTLRTSNAR